jgi:hypothetical protein
MASKSLILNIAILKSFVSLCATLFVFFHFIHIFLTELVVNNLLPISFILQPCYVFICRFNQFIFFCCLCLQLCNHISQLYCLLSIPLTIISELFHLILKSQHLLYLIVQSLLHQLFIGFSNFS